MKYNGLEVHETDGRDYKLETTTKRMLVWDDGQSAPNERDVIGFFQEFWVAADICGKGVCQWDHAAEIPKKPTIADYVQELHHKSGRCPYVVHPNGIPITEEENRDAVAVPEQEALLYIHNLADPSNTFVVLPGCREIVKNMFRALERDRRNYPPHADIRFFEVEEAE